MSDHGDAQADGLIADFAAAARALRDRSAELAMARLLPLELAEHELALRVHLMIAAGVLATARLAGSAAVKDLIDAATTSPWTCWSTSSGCSPRSTAAADEHRPTPPRNGERVDDQTVILIHEADGSWIIGQHDVRLSRDVMRIVAEEVLRRRRSEPHVPGQTSPPVGC